MLKATFPAIALVAPTMSSSTPGDMGHTLARGCAAPFTHLISLLGTACGRTTPIALAQWKRR